MQKLYLQGKGATIYDYSFATNSGSKLNLYNYVVYEESKDAVIKAMKENLGLSKVKPVKTFTFSIKNKFNEIVIGKNIGSTAKLDLMPNINGLDVSEAEYFARNNNIDLTVNYVDGVLGQRVGQILSQSVPVKTDLTMLNKGRQVTVTVVKEIVSTQTEEVEIEEESDEEILEDILPDNTEEDSESEDTDTKEENTSNTENNNSTNTEVENTTPEEPITPSTPDTSTNTEPTA